MRFAFCILACLFAYGASGATMCVPDYGLSSCESCTNLVHVNEMLYTAECCEKKVSLLLFSKSFDTGNSYTKSVSIENNDWEKNGDSIMYFFLMIKPVLAPYMVRIGCDYSSVNFSPKCAFTFCGEELYCQNADWK